MKTRRHFIQNAGLAGISLFFTQQVSAITRLFTPYAGFSSEDDKLVLLHLCPTHDWASDQASAYVTRMLASTPNVAVVHAGTAMPPDAPAFHLDAAAGRLPGSLLAPGAYQIIRKGKYSIGIFKPNGSGRQAVQDVNNMAKFLRTDQGCHLVACVSDLGFHHGRKWDDVCLVNETTGVDILIGAHASSFSKGPFISRNALKSDVVLHYGAANNMGIGHLEVSFDNEGNKTGLAFRNPLRYLNQQETV